MNERDRVLQVMQSEGMSAKVFCQEVGISQGTLSNILGGRNKPSLDVLQAILRRFRAISCDWLIMGVGTMYINGTREEGMLNLFEGEKDGAVNKSDSAVNKSDKECVEVPTVSALAVSQRVVSKILIFYSDGTFEER